MAIRRVADLCALQSRDARSKTASGWLRVDITSFRGSSRISISVKRAEVLKPCKTRCKTKLVQWLHTLTTVTDRAFDDPFYSSSSL